MTLQGFLVFRPTGRGPQWSFSSMAVKIDPKNSGPAVSGVGARLAQRRMNADDQLPHNPQLPAAAPSGSFRRLIGLDDADGNPFRQVPI